jgi:hypothetical protein
MARECNAAGNLNPNRLTTRGKRHDQPPALRPRLYEPSPGNDATQWIRDSRADLASLDVIQKWKLHLLEPSDNAHPAPPSPDVDHIVGSDRLHLAVAEVAFENARVARDFFAGTAFKKVLSTQAKHVGSSC